MKKKLKDFILTKGFVSVLVLSLCGLMLYSVRAQGGTPSNKYVNAIMTTQNAQGEYSAVNPNNSVPTNPLPTPLLNQDLSALNASSTYEAEGVPSVIVHITGTWAGAVDFSNNQGSSICAYNMDGTFPSSPCSYVETSDGTWIIPLNGSLSINVKMGSYSSGTCVVSFYPSNSQFGVQLLTNGNPVSSSFPFPTAPYPTPYTTWNWNYFSSDSISGINGCLFANTSDTAYITKINLEASPNAGASTRVYFQLFSSVSGTGTASNPTSTNGGVVNVLADTYSTAPTGTGGGNYIAPIYVTAPATITVDVPWQSSFLSSSEPIVLPKGSTEALCISSGAAGLIENAEVEGYEH